MPNIIRVHESHLLLIIHLKQKFDIHFTTKVKGIARSDLSLLSSNSMHKTGSNEVWKTPKGQVPIGLPYKVINVLLKFCLQIGLLVPRCAENFKSKECFLREILNSQKNMRFSNLSWNTKDFCEFNIL
jgi:hypothetical protein